MSEITQVLTAALSADGGQREAAMQWLQSAQQTDPATLMALLATELGNTQNAPFIRQQAGLQLKNCLATREEGVTEEKVAMWLAIDESVRQHIKGCSLMALGTEADGFLSAPQVVSTIAIAEIPNGLWPDLVPLLVQQFNAGLPDVGLQAILETLGYICQELSGDVLQAQSNNILTVVIGGMQHANATVKLAATTSLTNAIVFCKANFADDGERNIIMQTVCQATLCEDLRVKVAALQCLSKIMDEYYNYMEQYMGPALFGLTIAAMRSGQSEVQLQGIEFWSNVCENEIALISEMQAAEQARRAPEHICYYYAKGALGELVPLLLELLTTTDKDDDPDDWTAAKGAAVCLDLLSACVRDDILPLVIGFIQSCLQSPQWNFRDAAVQAFAAVLDGPSAALLKDLIDAAIMPLLHLMQDPSPQVKDSLAWAIGRICDLIPETIINEAYLPHVVTALLPGLAMEARVADNVCWAFNAMAEAAFRMADVHGVKPPTYMLSPYYEAIVFKLFETTEHPEAHKGNLRSSCYEAIMAFLSNFAEDCYPTVQQAFMQIVGKLQQTLHLHATDRDELQQFSEMQSLLCASLHVLLRNVHKEDVLQVSEPVMQILLAIFQSQAASAASVQEDALLAVSGVIETMEEAFLPYVDAVKPYVLTGLARKEEYEVCKLAVGVVGDLCRALTGNMLPHVEQFIALLMQALSDPNVDQTVKPVILSTFGDIALAIGVNFQPFLSNTLVALNGAATMAAETVDDKDEDTIEFMNELREGVIEAFTGILQAFKGPGDVTQPEVQILVPYVPHMVQFLQRIFADSSLSDSNVRSSLGLLGDLCSIYDRQIVPVLDKKFVSGLIAEGLDSSEAATRQTAKWAKKVIAKLLAL